MNDDSPTVLVHAKGLRKDYGSGEGLVRALDMVDLDVSRGEAVAVMGPSGCGKSTLLHLIGGLDRPSAGQLSVAGQRVDELSERALAYFRRDEIGLLKAVGGTPDLVAATFLAENLFLALVAALVGLLAGWRAAPLISNPEAELVGTPGAPPLTLVTVVAALAVALAVALASTLVPATRAARMSTVSALADAPRPPRRRDSLIRLSRKLPVPALFGLRLVARRPRRAVLSAASIAVTVMGLVAALAIHAAVDNKLSHFGSSGGLINPDIPRAEQVLTVLTILLVTLAALTAIFTALATVLDARRACAVTLALGATPQQIRAGLAMAQVIPALPGAILGLPLGLGLFMVAAHGLSGLPPALWLVAAVLGTVLAVAALTSVPARIGLRRPVAEMLQTEAT